MSRSARPIVPKPPFEGFLKCPDTTRQELRDAWELYWKELQAWAPKIEAYATELEAELRKADAQVAAIRKQLDGSVVTRYQSVRQRLVEVTQENRDLQAEVELCRQDADENRQRELKEQAEEQCETMRRNWLEEKRRRGLAEDDAYQWRGQLLQTTVELQAEKNAAYLDRDLVLALLVDGAAEALKPRRFLDEEADQDYRCVVAVELPTGQATWHVHVDRAKELFAQLPLTANDWDGHTTTEKHERIVRALLPPGLDSN
jgi:hypothetical protein